MIENASPTGVGYSRLKAGDWKKNALGRHFSHNFGYGLVNAGQFVYAAKHYKDYLKQHRVCIKDPFHQRNMPVYISDKRAVKINIVYDGHCSEDETIEKQNITKPDEVNMIEHVILKVSVKMPNRGDIRISIVSPSGTQSTLMPSRQKDKSRQPLMLFPLMSAHFWGENPYGVWTVHIGLKNKNRLVILICEE